MSNLIPGETTSAKNWLSRAGKSLACLVPALLLLSPDLNAASPRINYLLQCTGCHGSSGAGSPPNVPTLVGELGRMLTVPQMREYLLRVPGASQALLSDRDLTDVMNWMLIEFNTDTLPDDFKKYTADEITTARSNVLADPLKYRIEYWAPYQE